MPVRRNAAFVVLLTLIAGCGSGASSHPRALPKLGPSAVAVAPAKEATAAGAVAFARLFYASITEAFATADPTLVSSLSEPTCRTCALYIATLTKLRDRHERTTPVTFTLHFAVAPATDGKTARVEVQYDVPASTRYDAAGRVIYREQASVRVNETVTLVRHGTSWLVVEMR